MSNSGVYDPNDAPEVSYTWTATGAIDKVDFKGGNDLDYAYTLREWVETINNVASPGGNFAASYDYADNGNVQKAQFHNPLNQLSGHDHYHYGFSYDNLNRLTGADYGYGASSDTTLFDVGNFPRGCPREN